DGFICEYEVRKAVAAERAAILELVEQTSREWHNSPFDYLLTAIKARGDGMTDIVERLRACPKGWGEVQEAADEIERLRAALQKSAYGSYGGSAAKFACAALKEQGK